MKIIVLNRNNERIVFLRTITFAKFENVVQVAN